MKGRNYLILTFKKQEFYFNVLMRDEKEERDGDEQIFITFLFILMFIVQGHGACFCYNFFIFYSAKSKISLRSNHVQ